ncbi:MAG TPA: serine/threonine-protein kinase, partial [Kofleriaceae bacterium]|nr:serine/threonine-protein kinase [Kofleriaceae bacterium]
MSQTGGSEAQESPSLIGQILDGRYRIIRKLGEGGMGEVFAAEHVHIEKRFAIKLLRPEIVSNAEAVTRFRQEARSSSSIGHRNIIAIEDFGQLADGRIYMCMELLNGAALNDMITQPIGVDRLLNILIQTGHGLAAAHAKGIIHRDMKPENIFVTIGPNGEDIPKLLDFGIAKVSGNDGQNHLTRTGTIFGTPFYMAPEQALGNAVDARTDIYAVGVIMYECFAGSLPFQGDSFMGILTQHITMDPEPVAQRAAKAGRALPPGLADVITRCMQKNPAQRFSTMDELVNVLVQIYRGVVGPGMSTYMEAFPVLPSSAHQVQPTPPPMTGPVVVAGPTAGTVAAIGPSGSAPIAMPPGPGGYHGSPQVGY